MATISFNIPDAAIQRVIDAFAGSFGYSAILTDNTPNPQTKSQFTKAVIASWIKDVVKSWEGSVAAESASTVARNDVELNVTIS